jgi:hypothetical protein
MTFAVSILRLIDKLPHRPGADVISRRLARSPQFTIHNE